jgi:RNA polymerase sigma-54 factor
MEEIERPSFENFLSKPTNLTDHLAWQLGALSLRREVREAADIIIGNLNEDGYLIASDDELLGVAPPAPPEADVVTAKNIVSEAQALGLAEVEPDAVAEDLSGSGAIADSADLQADTDLDIAPPSVIQTTAPEPRAEASFSSHSGDSAAAVAPAHEPAPQPASTYKPKFVAADLQEALEVVRQLDPPGVGCRDLRECLLYQLRYHQAQLALHKNGNGTAQVLQDAMAVVEHHLRGLQNKQYGTNDKNTRDYVKERYKSAIQLIKNIEQRKQTITKVCYCIVARQQDFLERGIDQLKPMMIKEVAEEIGVHPSTVSRAVSSKYAHTPQGVFELRYFFSESVQGPEGGNTSLLILKRRVKKLIDEEDPSRPLTDEQITRILQSQGIQVTRRTVAKYREDMRIPSTHQRRVKK